MAPRTVSTIARKGRNRNLFAGAAWIALMAAGTPTWAANYDVANESDLRAAVLDANASSDASATITLTNSFSMAPNILTSPNKPITINTAGFTLRGDYNPATLGNRGALTFQNAFPAGGQIILSGTLAGGSGGAAAATAGQAGLWLTNRPIVTNNGTILGGAGGGAGGSGGSGTFATSSTLTNNGVIQGGDSPTANGGSGVELGGTVVLGTLINNGTIRGGSGPTNGPGSGGAGLVVRSGAAPITNAGTIEGGTGAVAITTNSATVSLNLVNSGTIRAGAGQANAIQLIPTVTTGIITLELQGGAAIQGNVIGNASLATDVLRLGGTANGTFDGIIGTQYQNFDVFEKTGTSTWTLTGASTAASPWLISQGTLQLGNGASIIGTITNNATLAFNRSEALTFANVINGTGGVVQAGSGTTILSGVNSYAGGTFLNGGTLSVSGEANLGDAAGSITFNDGVLQVTGTGFTSTTRTINWGGGGFDIADAANVFTVSQTLSGTGSLAKLGAGTLVLTTNDTYTGGTTISSGTLQLGTGGTAGGVTGSVTNNGALAFNRSDDVAFGGVISGTGSVRQLGGGTTTLSGNNTYTGGTTISGGTLIGSASSFGSGTITNNAALIINQPADAGFANAINGSGSFTKQGAGRLNYTGTGTLNGATTVAAGLLSVNGSLANSAVTVQSGARLGGNGTVGATSVQSGGTIAPGNSIGTLQVNGVYTQAAGSIYQVEVDPNSNASDRIAVTGTATLQSGAGLNVTKSVAGDYRLGAVYTVLSTTGGRTGTYTLSGETTGVSAYLALRDTYDANNAYLTVVQTRDPADAAQTPNQQAVADNLPAGGVTTPILNLPSDDAARDAFNQLSAQALASAKGALVSNGLYVRDATLDRLRDVRCKTTENQNVRNAACESDQPSLWAQGFGGWGGVSGNANASGVNRSSAGMLAGFDLPVMDWRLGMFGGFSNSDFHLTGGPASGQTTDYHLGAYGGTDWNGISLSLGASYSWNTIRTDRSVAFGSFTDRLQATYNAGVTQVFADAGYGMDMFGVTLEPFANLAYLNLRADGFSEVGGAAALSSQADTIENAITTFGVRPSTTVDLGSFPVTLRGMAGWRHTFGTVTPTSTVAFAGGNAFTISGAPIARDAMALEAGLDFALADTISAGLTYGGQISSRTTDQTARGTIRISF